MATGSEQLARFSCELQLSDVPPELLTKVKEHILDTVGVSLIGCSVPFIQSVREYAVTFGSPGRSTLVGPRHEKLDAEHAAIFNGTAAMATEMDNHHVVSSHPCSVVPGSFAVAEELSSSGAECLRGIVVAYEITSRLAMATTPSLALDRYFTNSAIYNGFGVAASASLLMGLAPEQLVHALAITGSHAGGMTTNNRHAVGRYHAGQPAANGIRAARLAKFGLRGTPELFDHPKGFFNTFSAKPKPELLTKDLDSFVGIEGLRLKHTYASVGNIAPQIEALLTIMRDHKIDHHDIAEIRVGCDPMMMSTTTTGPQFESFTGVDDVTAGHFCTPLQLGITAVKGRNDFPTLLEVAEGGFRDPDLRRIAGVVSVALDPECVALFPETWMTKVTVVTKDGNSFQERGFAMTEPDVYEKFREIAGPIVPAATVETLIERVMSIEELDHLGAITELMELPA